ncbi:DegT/DnrJ/EryC1/StrS family aminotransferase [Microbacterium sp. ASV49]|uniref:DegT/DnrJ/EryC1/StrS family aminotransferase n=1 Tax=Microbacterium candidum TaxID=3041922 RepID=A0ABT7N0R2_9MICO|nr:DegT/DnrJ/EryC1/StrS family aminotransferase [Microbacterium sp. ASV49]MDL9980298.1 DegT/DnrJ/EryC1/StrS family aminotransferase [Microbacterium sp. ASV49]
MEDEVPFYDLASLVAKRRSDLLDAIESVVDSGMFIGGRYVEEFEQAFAESVGVEHCIAVGNGLDALRISLECAGVGPGDEVIVPGFTFYATWLAVLQVGARPVPIDVDWMTGSMDPALLDEAMSAHTRAVLPVHLYGIPADNERISALAADRGVPFIEDAAQAHGASVGTRPVGSWGIAGAFSFYPTKNMGALGDAGAIVTSSSELANRARSRRSYGQGSTKYDHVDTGWNSRMDPIQAAILTGGLKRLPADNSCRRDIARTYLDALADAPSAVVGAHKFESSVWHHFVVRATDRDQLRNYLASRGIRTDVHYPYAFDTLQPTRATLESGADLPVSRAFAKSVLSLPIGAWMTSSQVTLVAEALSSIPRELLARAELS